MFYRAHSLGCYVIKGRRGALDWWAWGWATVGTLVLSFLGSIIAVILAARLIRRGSRRQGAAVIATSLVIAVAALAVYLEIRDANTTHENGQGSGMEVSKLMEGERLLEEVQAANSFPRRGNRHSMTEAGLKEPSAKGDRQINVNESPKQIWVSLLDSWTHELDAVVSVLHRRASLYEAGEVEKSLTIGRQAKREIKPILHWGGAARSMTVILEKTPLSHAVIVTGDAWAQWASAALRLLPTGGSLTQGEHMADLGVYAARVARRAYRVAGAKIPPEWTPNP